MSNQTYKQPHFKKKWIFENIFCIFYDFLKNIYGFSEKITQFFQSFHSQILLYDCVFWQFSIDLRYVEVYGKLRNLQKIVPGGLWKLWIEKWPLTWFLTKWGFHCITLLLCLQMAPNAIKSNQMQWHPIIMDSTLCDMFVYVFISVFVPVFVFVFVCWLLLTQGSLQLPGGLPSLHHGISLRVQPIWKGQK